MDITSISLEQKIAQMAVLGFYGTEPKAIDQLMPGLSNVAPGGFILYQRKESDLNNIRDKAQIIRLTNFLKKSFEIAPLIGIDQEGGKVARLNSRNGFSDSLPAAEIGKADDQLLSEKQAEEIAKCLEETGINLDLAPVVDLSINPRSPGLAEYGRCYSCDEQIVIQQATTFCKIMDKHHIHTCLKHFPGLGSASNDTHYEFTDITKSWKEKELRPYQELLHSGYRSLVLISHAYHKNLDKLYPASLSYQVVTNLLRSGLKCDNVVITDDLQMKAVAKQYDLRDRIRLAIQAGNDLLLFSNNQPEYYVSLTDFIEIVLQLIRSGEILPRQIDESWQRINKLKGKFIDI